MNSIFGNLDGNFQEDIVKGKPLKIGKRTIYPVIQLSNIEIKGIFWFESITPVALAVIEPDNRYFIPLDEENLEINDWLKNEPWAELGIKID